MQLVVIEENYDARNYTLLLQGEGSSVVAYLCVSFRQSPKLQVSHQIVKSVSTVVTAAKTAVPQSQWC